MKFANVNGNKTEAAKGLIGQCRFCNSDMIPKCGEFRADHWAHKSKHNCDQWWENETDWHRSWKDHFLNDWQEEIHVDENSGEKHIADVKTDGEWVIEFQYSYLKPEERRARTLFYPKLVWVVNTNGTRRKTDKKFQKILESTPPLIQGYNLRRIDFPEEHRLLREWCNNKSVVFFDFKFTERSEDSDFWMLFPFKTPYEIYLSTFSRQQFIELHRNNEFEQAMQTIAATINKQLQLINLVNYRSPIQIAQSNMAKRPKKKPRL